MQANLFVLKELQIQISDLVATLARNYQKFNQERLSFAEKTQSASRSYQDVQHLKHKLVEHLNRLDELMSINNN